MDGKIVEVGSWKGKSTAFLLVEAWNKSPRIEIYAVDTWLGSEEHTGEECIKNGTLYEEFLKNVKPVSRQLIPFLLRRFWKIGCFTNYTSTLRTQTCPRRSQEITSCCSRPSCPWSI
jgi:hypothetical protein